MKYIVEWHQDCIEPFPHKPEKKVEFSSLKSIMEKSKEISKTNFYVDWNTETRLIIKDGEISHKKETEDSSI